MSNTNNTDLPKLIISKVLHDDQFCRSILPFIKSKYFSGGEQIIYKILRDFVNDHNVRPTKTAFEIELQNSDMVSERNSAELFGTINKIFNKDYADVDSDWLYNTTEKWCKERAMYLAVVESFNIIQAEDAETKTGMIPDMMKDALSVSFDNNIGHDYINDAFPRYEYYQKKEIKVPFDIEMLNKITNGGVSKKTLNLLIAGVNVGKSLSMGHMAAAAMASGKNVLYISMEMAEEEIAKRIDANLLDIPIAQLEHTSHKVFDNRINSLKKRSCGNLIIKEYPTGSAHAGHFRALLNDIKLKKGYVPDIIFIDYLNICASSRYKGSAGDSYGLVKSISEEIRGLAVEFDTIIWSATQLNREGFGSSDPTMQNTSESFGINATADLLLAIVTTEELEKMSQYLVKQLKNRYNSKSDNKRFVIGVDYDKMRLYDVEDSAQVDISDSGQTESSNSQSFTPQPKQLSHLSSLST